MAVARKVLRGRGMFIPPVRRAFAVLLILATRSPAGAEEPATPPSGDAAVTQIASIMVHNGYQGSNQELLQGFTQTVVFGFRITAATTTFQEFLEAGISRLDTADSPLVTSSALVGARLAWRRDRFALHLFARFHHGDGMAGDDGETIYSHAISLGLMGSYDLLRIRGHSAALALHTIGEFRSASDAEGDSTLAAAGGGGISLLAW